MDAGAPSPNPKRPLSQRIELWVAILSVIVVVALVFLIWNRYHERYEETPLTTINNGVTIENSNTNASETALSAAIVADHATADDCWIIVSGNVYAVSTYLNRHPGGAKEITPYCGQDATIAFATKGGEGQHSRIAERDLAALLVGSVGDTPTNANAQPTAINGTVTIPDVTVTETPTVGSSTVTLMTATIAQHATSGDCWIIISGTVYNITAYLRQHPGGAAIITPYCGRDATTAFATQGGGGQHSSMASLDLANFAIGTVGSTVSMPSVTLQPAPSAGDTSTAPAQTTTESEDEHEEEEEDKDED